MTDETLPVKDSTDPANDETLVAPSGSDKTISYFFTQKGIDAGQVNLGASGSDMQLNEKERYAIGAELARGGMGAVLNAKDLNLRRDVAMKIALNPKAAKDAQIVRFVHEAQVTGQLEHPSIVPVYELGIDAEDQVYYTMKYIRGTNLGDILAGIRSGDTEMLERYPLTRLLNIFIKACDALAFSHSRGVIHRDLKPDNIMVGDFGEVLIVDWGLAKVLGDMGNELPEDAEAYRAAGTTDGTVVESVRDTQAAMNTLDGAVMGTPAFMPPEQADGDIAALGPLADVYSMGAILHTILTLEAPIQGQGVDVLLEKVRTSDFVPPLAHDGEHPHCPGGSIPTSLSAVATKAMAHGLDDRYPSVVALQEDVQAYLDGFATQAEEASLWRLVQLFVARHKGMVISGVTAFILLTVVLAVAFVINLQARRAAEAAEVIAVEAQREEAAQRELAESNAEEARMQREAAVAAEARARTESDRLAWQLYRSHILSAMREWDVNVADASRVHLDAATHPRRDWEARYLEALFLRDCEVLEVGQDLMIHAVAFSPDGKKIVGGGNHSLALWDAATGDRLKVLSKSTIRSVAFSPDGSRLASGHQSGVFHLWDMATGESLKRFAPRNGKILSLAFSPDGRRLASGLSSSRLMVWDVATGEVVLKLDGDGVSDGPIHSLAYSPDGTRIATTRGHAAVTIRDAETGAEQVRLSRLKAGEILGLAFSPNGRHLATVEGNVLALWDTKSGKLLKKIQAHYSATSVSYSPDGKLLVTGGGGDKTVKLWDAESLSLRRTFKGHSHGVVSVAFSPDGQWVVSSAGTKQVANGSAELRLWDVQAPPEKLPRTAGGDLVSFAPDGEGMVVGNAAGVVKIWDYEKRKVVHLLRMPDTILSAVVVSKNGRLIATGDNNKFLKLWDTRTGELLRTMTDSEAIKSVAFSPDSGQVASGNQSGVITLWEVNTGKKLKTLQHAEVWVKAVKFSPDGRRIATGCGPIVKLWDTRTGEEECALSRARGDIEDIEFSLDGRLVAAGSKDALIRIWDTASGDLQHTLEGHTMKVTDISFSPNGARLASSSWDRTIRVWDTQTGQMLLALNGHEASTMSVAFSPDGSRLLSGDGKRNVRIWDASVERPFLRRGRVSVATTAEASHSRHAEVSESTGDWYAAAWHLHRLVALSPDDLALQERLNRALAHLRERGYILPEPPAG